MTTRTKRRDRVAAAKARLVALRAQAPEFAVCIRAAEADVARLEYEARPRARNALVALAHTAAQREPTPTTYEVATDHFVERFRAADDNDARRCARAFARQYFSDVRVRRVDLYRVTSDLWAQRTGTSLLTLRRD